MQSMDDQAVPPKRDTTEPRTPRAIVQHAILRHLPYFVVVARELNFHRAAGILNITQSGLSRRIKALEEEIGAPLFDRSQRGTRLTAPGAILYEDSRSLLRAFERTIDRVHLAIRGKTGILRVGMNEGAARSAQVTGALRAFRERFPGVHLELLPMLTEEQRTALASGSLDVGFFYDLSRDKDFDAHFETRLLKSEPMVLAISADHAFARKSHLTVADLVGQPLIWPSREHGQHLYDRMIAAFQASGQSPRIAFEVLTGEMTANMAASGLGMGFVGRDQLVPGSVALRAIEGFDVSLDLQIVWQRAQRLETLQHLLDLLDDFGDTAR